MPSLTRPLFVTVTAIALGVLLLSVACTRRGGNGAPPVVTPTPISAYYVDPVKGKDTNPGTQALPFKTIGKALSHTVGSTAPGLTIALAAGTYSTASGETFPIVIPSGAPSGLALSGASYGHSLAKGTFINGSGEDTRLEKALGAPMHSLYATLVVPAGFSISLAQVYVGTRTPVSSGTYAAVDVMGSVSANHDTFGAAVRGVQAGGTVIPSGTLTCMACFLTGPTFAITAFTLPSATAGPTITLQGPGHSVIASAVGLRTDGTAKVTASSQVFQSTDRAYTDALAASSPGPSPSPSTSPTGSPTTSPTGTPYYGGCTVDFGYGSTGSLGGNTFGGGRTEIEVTRTNASICALADTWNYHTQGTNRAGQYAAPRIFRPGASGKNVTISSAATGSNVYVGPAPAPTATPSATPSPYGSSSPSPSPSPTPT